MKITNKYNLPSPLVNATSWGIRGIKENTISVTQLIDSPQIFQLRKKHNEEIEEDVSDRIWALLGTSVHYILEGHAEKNYLSEEKLKIEIDGWTLTGIPDLLDSDGTLSDYKVTSVYSFLLGEKENWNLQTNVYAYLYGKHNFRVNKIQIVAILRDWQKSRLLADNNYPQCPVIVKPITLSDTASIEKYIHERISLHQEAEKTGVYSCNFIERWKREDTFACIKKGNKKASRIFDTQNEAEEYCKLKELELEIRKGGYIRCENYCNVAKFCTQNNIDIGGVK